MKVNQLAGNASVDVLEVEVIDKELPRDVKGGALKVANATGKDETGTVKLTFWNDQINQVNVGDVIKISNGWVNEFQNNLQVSTGRGGTLEVLSKSAANPMEKAVSATDDSGFVDADELDDLDISEEQMDY